jgi:hypothetical protein
MRYFYIAASFTQYTNNAIGYYLTTKGEFPTMKQLIFGARKRVPYAERIVITGINELTKEDFETLQKD